MAETCQDACTRCAVVILLGYCQETAGPCATRSAVPVRPRDANISSSHACCGRDQLYFVSRGPPQLLFPLRLPTYPSQSPPLSSPQIPGRAGSVWLRLHPRVLDLATLLFFLLPWALFIINGPRTRFTWHSSSTAASTLRIGPCLHSPSSPTYQVRVPRIFAPRPRSVPTGPAHDGLWQRRRRGHKVCMSLPPLFSRSFTTHPPSLFLSLGSEASLALALHAPHHSLIPPARHRRLPLCLSSPAFNCLF